MQYLKLALPLALASGAVANPLLRRDACTSDACIAAVTGKAALGDDGLRADHCKSFLATTVTPEAITVTTTITGVETDDAWGKWKREQVTVCPNEVPNYASACETAAYSSACSCFGYFGDSTTTLKPTTTTKTVYVSATGTCSGGVSTKTVTVTVPSGYSNTSILSGVFTSTVFQTSSVCPTGPGGVVYSTVTETASVCPTTSGLGFSTSTSTSTVTATSAVTSTVTTTASGSTCPTSTATTSTVTVSGTTSTVTVSGTTSTVTTTTRASTCPGSTTTTSTVTVSGTTSTVTVSGTTSTVTTTTGASTCPSSTATTSTVTVSGTTSTVTVSGTTSTVTTTTGASTCPTTTATTSTITSTSAVTSTVTTTESASSCPTTSATTTTVTTTETTTTTSSSTPAATCLSQDQVDTFVSAFTDFLENTDTGYSLGYSGPFNQNLALSTFSDDFEDSSDSINYMAGYPLGSVTFPSKYAFIGGQGSQYPVGVESVKTFVGCKFFTWHYILITGAGVNNPVSGINVFEVTDDLTQIKSNIAEFNNGAWLENIGNPAGLCGASTAIASASAACAATTTTTTAAAAATTTSDAATTTSSSGPGARRRY